MYPLCDLFACLVAEDESLVTKWCDSAVQVSVRGDNDSGLSGLVVEITEGIKSRCGCIVRVVMELDRSRIFSIQEEFIDNTLS